MIPINQTSFYDPEDETRGNCLHACIASIFHLEIDSIGLPDICYAQDVINWTNQRYSGWQCINQDWCTNYQVASEPTDERPQGGWVYHDPEYLVAPHYGYWIGAIYSPRIKLEKSNPYWPRSGYHAVVMKGYNCVHDPHPEGNIDFEGPVLNGIWWVVADPFLAT